MKYLADANIWFQAIFGLQYATDVARMLATAPAGMLATTDFAIHAIGVRIGKAHPHKYLRFLDDLAKKHVSTLHLPPSMLRNVISVMQQHTLDFDDAFQYVAAERDDLKIVSFDTDFDRTPRGRITPAKVLAELAKP